MDQKNRNAYIVLLIIAGIAFLLINSHKISQITGDVFYSPANLIITILIFIFLFPIFVKINRSMAKKNNAEKSKHFKKLKKEKQKSDL